MVRESCGKPSFWKGFTGTAATSRGSNLVASSSGISHLNGGTIMSGTGSLLGAALPTAILAKNSSSSSSFTFTFVLRGCQSLPSNMPP